MIAASVAQAGRVLRPLSPHAPQPACMGGWCAVRESCGHYYRDTVLYPSERLCDADRRDAYVPLSIGTRPKDAPQ